MDLDKHKHKEGHYKDNNTFRQQQHTISN